MKKLTYAERLFESAFLLVIIFSLLFLYTFKAAALYKIENAHINNEEGFIYFHSYYGEKNNSDFESDFTQKEQNVILKSMLYSLSQSEYGYFIDYMIGFDDVNTVIINSNTINYFELDKFVEEGRMIQGSIDLNSSSEMVIPVLVGHNLKDIYGIGDIISVDIYNKNIKYVVNGILSEESKINFGLFYDMLDNVVILPQINFVNQPNEREEYKLQNYILYCECNGYFLYNKENPYDEIKKFCDNIAIEEGVQWKPTNKIENKLEGIEIPIELDTSNICIIIIYLITGIVGLYYLLAGQKGFNDVNKIGNPMIKYQTNHAICTIIMGIIVYEISLYLAKRVLCNSIYYDFLLDNRMYAIIFIGGYIVIREGIYWKKLSKNRLENER